jgi:hypothetical protein
MGYERKWVLGLHLLALLADPYHASRSISVGFVLMSVCPFIRHVRENLLCL